MSQPEKIVQRVSQMITSLGVKSVRMDDVASEMGISKRTLYEMFGDKEELLYQSLVYLIEQRNAALAEKTRGCENMLEVLLVSVREMCGNGSISDAECRISRNLKKFYPAVYERLQHCNSEKGVENLRYALDKCNADGLLDPNADIGLMAKLFLLTISLFLSDSHISLPDGVCREEAFAVMTINFLRGVASAKGLEVIDGILARDKARQDIKNEQ